jgi:hypothetical protein
LSAARSTLVAAIVMNLATLGLSISTHAQSCSSLQTPSTCTPSGSIRAELGPFDVQGLVLDLKQDGFKTELKATLKRAGSSPPAQQTSNPTEIASRATGAAGLSLFCRRDDAPFLPPGATAGLPCEGPTRTAMPDPRDIARSMFDRLDLPSLRLGMNPQLGMVAVPTWFWAEGYDGKVIPLTDNLVLTHEECHRVIDRDADGSVLLDGDGAPVSHRECRAISDTLTVEVRVWPRSYQWTFGDEHGMTIQCPDIGACPAGLGRPYTNPRTPSPIAHAYRWSSLGKNGDADAYTIRLAITFGAQFRFSTNGASRSGWESLGDRDLTRSANHRVQEAQAVLTRP